MGDLTPISACRRSGLSLRYYGYLLDDLGAHSHSLIGCIQNHPRLQESNNEVSLKHGQDDGAEPYRLGSECRHCLTVFATEVELRQHSLEEPEHQKPFSERLFNNASPNARCG